MEKEKENKKAIAKMAANIRSHKRKLTHNDNVLAPMEANERDSMELEL